MLCLQVNAAQAQGRYQVMGLGAKWRKELQEQ